MASVVYNAVSVNGTVRGVERYHLGVLPALAALDADLRIAVLRAPWQEYYAPLAGLPGIDLVTVAPPRSRARRGLWQLLDGGLRGRAPDLIHLGNVLPAPAAARAPIVSMVHDVIEFRASGSYDPLRRWARRRLVRRLGRRSRALVTVAEGTARELEALLGLPSGAVEPIGMGVEPPPPGVAVRPAAGRDRAIVFVGGIDVHKRLDLAVAALAELPGLELRVVSAGGQAEPAVRELARRLRVDDRVHWLGRLDDREAREVVARSAALVMPSDLEGFGIPILEALQVGTPAVISSGVPLASEWCRHGGPVFRQGDAADLAAALRRLLADDAGREALTRLGPELAAGYTWLAVAERLLAVWRRVLGRPGV
ncbi:MAG TPA: glycosyltransferase [Candidatus Dormibacteraeota bacterium]|nr:glycosyltransferase [Candidatus Dormibacteraeota bacterium]